MDFDKAKENIQPLASGRDVSLLQASLNANSAQELLAQRRQYESDIHNYKGQDPLEPWYSYICWIEQSFPSGGKESGLDEVLRHCFKYFESDTRYNQDRRLIKLYLKFILNRKEPLEYFNRLYSGGIGTMVADFYISWAYCYELLGNARKADEVFRMGIKCRAQPIEELQEAQQHYGFIMAQRIMYKDDEQTLHAANQQLHERRLALSTLRSSRRGSSAVVGSIRTGAVLKSHMPGKIKLDAKEKSANVCTPYVQSEEAVDVATTSATASELSVVRSILEIARDEENQLEPGPWDKAADKKQARKLFSKTSTNKKLSFDILEDQEPTDINDCKSLPPFKYPAKFYSKNLPQKPWNTRVTLEQTKTCYELPHYNKMKLYANANVDYQPEELLAYHWLKRKQIKNAFTQHLDAIWESHNIDVPIRLYAGFARESMPQKSDEMDIYFEPPPNSNMVCPFEKLYVAQQMAEYQYEELRCQKMRQKNRRRTVMTVMDMDETACFDEAAAVGKSTDVKAMRRSCMAHKRMSVAPVIFNTEQAKKKQPLAGFVDIAMDVGEDIKEEDEEEAEEENLPEILKKQQQTQPIAYKAETPCFNIYEDTVTLPIAAAVTTGALPPNDENRPIFKTPMLPAAATAKSNKLPFAVHADEDVASPGKATFAAAFFDADETCSTQAFNVFLNTQTMMSTPKVMNKVIPRQLGQCVALPMLEQKLPEMATAAASIAEENSNPIVGQEESPPVSNEIAAINAVTPNYCSVQPKQLSTILEISEHGSTQGTTHTTGSGTHTKFICSPTENEAEALTRPAFAELETVYEQSRENTNNSVGSKVELKLSAATPAATRLAVNEIKAEELPNVGNFSRIIEIEDTLPMMALSALQQPVQFQVVDRTETFDKQFSFALAAGSAALSAKDDKTDNTISRLISNMHLPIAGYQQDKTETIPKIELKSVNDSLGTFCLPSTPLKSNQSVNKREAEQANIEALPKLIDNIAVFDDNCDSFIAATQSQTQRAAVVDAGSFVMDSQPAVAAKSISGLPSKLQANAELLKKSANELQLQPTAPAQEPCLDFNATSWSFINESPQQNAKQSPLIELQHDSKHLNVTNQQHSMFSNKSMYTTQELLCKSITSSNQNLELPPPPTINANINDVLPNVEHNSIYYQITPRTPNPAQHWQHYDSEDDDDVDVVEETADPASSQRTNKVNSFIHADVNLNETHQMIDNLCSASIVNPFNADLIHAFLEQTSLIDYISKLPNCMLVRRVPRLQPGMKISVHDQQFQVTKVLGSGSYGVVYRGIHKQSNKQVALKQEKPSNCWEYYICLEIQSRLENTNMLAAFMSVDYALIGNNSSILISDYSKHGSLIAVCNKIKKYTARHVDESILILLASELLEIVDHLHAMHIIHADIKADNILLMQDLSYPSYQRHLQLIDFGVSIDMQLFKPQQTFTYVNAGNSFKCVEMHEGRPWTYQLDLFGLASVLHALLFGQHMEIQRRSAGFWMHSSHVPRYYNKSLWENVFYALLNVRDCNSMPNLQQLRAQLKAELLEKEHCLQKKITEFNYALKQN